MEFYSQYGQDKWLLDNYFSNKKDGFFLEIGADDGIDKSNTKFYEELGWKGLCIEPSPTRFKKLANNRNCYCENIAISTTAGSVEFMDIAGYGKGLSGIVSKYDTRHVSRIQQELTHPDNKGHEIITVETTTLSTLLEKYNMFNIDFCTIDTEGGELDILKTIDFDKYSIDILVIENNYNDIDIKTYLESVGYKFETRLVIDDVYVKL
jgi:FkbM family methyltransferase